MTVLSIDIVIEIDIDPSTPEASGQGDTRINYGEF